MSDSRLQEIVTKAVVGRAERRVTWSHTVPAEGVTGVLGVHVTGATVAVKDEDGRAVVDVLVDLDLWCAYHKSTKVLRCTCRRTEAMEIRTVGSVLGDADLNAKLLANARATGVRVGEGQVTVSMEADAVVEMTALTRMWVKAYDTDDDVLYDVDETDDSTYSSGSGSISSSGVGSGSRSGMGSGTGE